MRKLHDDGLPTLFSVYPEGVGIAPDGLFGGRPGGAVHGVRARRGRPTSSTIAAPENWSRSPRPTAVVEVQLGGGAGFGDPARRTRARVEDDVADGYVSREAAARDHGAALASAAE